MDISDDTGRQTKKKPTESGVTKVESLKVRPLWLTVSPSERYLLLEDTETGDVLLPLIYMKSMFEANYSRKLSSLKHRIVALPERFSGEKPRGFVYWQWAFESPHEVKVLVRKMLGEENTPQGHLRLILLPIVFNAMAQKAKLRESHFFQKMEKAVRASTYWPLLKIPIMEAECDLKTAMYSPAADSAVPSTDSALLISGTGDVSVLEDEASGRLVEGGGQLQPGSSALLSEGGEGSAPEQQEKNLFHGPYNLHRTISKYCLSYEAVEAVESRKGSKLSDPVNLNQQYEDEVAAYNTLEFLKEQNEHLKSEMGSLKLEYSRQMMNLNMQLQEMKDSFGTLASRIERAFQPQQQQLTLQPSSSKGLSDGDHQKDSLLQHLVQQNHDRQQIESRLTNQRQTHGNHYQEVDLRLGPASWGTARGDEAVNFGGHVKREAPLAQDFTQGLGQTAGLQLQTNWSSLPMPLPNSASASSSRLPHWLSQSSRASTEQLARFPAADSAVLQGLQNEQNSRSLQHLFGMRFMQPPPQ